jgi:MFS family permease
VAPSPERVLSGAFLRVVAANFCFFMTFAAFFLLPLHVRALGGTERTVGLVMGTAGISGLASVAVAGWLLDRFGRRLCLLAGLALMGSCAAAYLAVDRIGPALYALRAMQGIAFTAGFNAASTLIVELAPIERRATALGLFGVSTLTTHALAPGLGEILVRTTGFDALFRVAAAFSVVGFALAWPLRPPPLHLHGRPGRFRPGPVLWAIFATTACCGAAFGTVLTYTPTFVVDARLGPVATFFLSYTGAAIVTRLFGGRLGDTFERRAVILPALLLLAVAILGLASVGSAPALAATGVVFGAAQGIAYPTLNAYAVDQSPPDRLGRVQTLYNGAFNLGVTGGSILLGPVAHTAGHRWAFRCAAGMAALAFAVFRFGTGSAGTLSRVDARALDSATTGAD